MLFEESMLHLHACGIWKNAPVSLGSKMLEFNKHEKKDGVQTLKNKNIEFDENRV